MPSGQLAGVNACSSGDIRYWRAPLPTQGAALQPVGILVEPDRILLVSDPAGIYEFARPDKLPAPSKQSGEPEPASQ